MRVSLLSLWALAQAATVLAAPFPQPSVDTSSPSSTTQSSATTTTSSSAAASSTTFLYIANDIVDKVPSCAQSCYLGAIAGNFHVQSACGLSPSLQCLCSLKSTADLTLAETAVKCITKNCSADEASETVQTQARTMCDAYSSLASSSTTTVLSTSTVSPSSTFATSTRTSTSSASTSTSTSPAESSTSSLGPTVTFLPVTETTSTSDPDTTSEKGSSTSDTPKSEKGHQFTVAQAVGLGVGLTGAILIGILAIICGRRQRRKRFDSRYLEDFDYRQAAAAKEGGMIEISAPIHDDPEYGAATPNVYDHFGSTAEGHAHELYMMENAPSKAFVKRTSRLMQPFTTAVNKTRTAVALSSDFRASIMPSRPIAAFSKSGHQRLPSEDVEFMGSASPGRSERKKPPKLPLTVTVTAPTPSFDRTSPRFMPSSPPVTQAFTGQVQVIERPPTSMSTRSNVALVERPSTATSNHSTSPLRPAADRSFSPPLAARAQTPENQIRSESRNQSHGPSPDNGTPGRSRKNPGLSVTVPIAQPSRHERIVKVHETSKQPMAQSGIIYTHTQPIPPPPPPPLFANFAVKDAPREPKRYGGGTERDSMMTEFEEDSLVSERERRMMASGVSFSSNDRGSARAMARRSQRQNTASAAAVPQPVPEAMPAYEMDYTLSSNNNNSDGNPFADTAAIKAYNPGARVRSPPTRTFQAYSVSTAPNGVPRATGTYTTVSGPVMEPQYKQPPFRVITDSHEVNAALNEPEFPFQNSMGMARGASVRRQKHSGTPVLPEVKTHGPLGIAVSSSSATAGYEVVYGRGDPPSRELTLTPQRRGNEMFLDFN